MYTVAMYSSRCYQLTMHMRSINTALQLADHRPHYIILHHIDQFDLHASIHTDPQAMWAVLKQNH